MSDPYVFTDSQIVDIRRFLGYEAYGNGAAGVQSFRYFVEYGILEYRMGNCTTDEATVVQNYLATLTGLETAIFATQANFPFTQVAVVHYSIYETRRAVDLFNYQRARLAKFFGVPLGDDAAGVGRMLVV